MVRIVWWKKKQETRPEKALVWENEMLRTWKNILIKKEKLVLSTQSGRNVYYLLIAVFSSLPLLGTFCPFWCDYCCGWVTHRRLEKGIKSSKSGFSPQQRGKSADIPLETFSFWAPKKRSWWRTGFLNCFSKKFFTLLSINYIQWGCTKNL